MSDPRYTRDEAAVQVTARRRREGVVRAARDAGLFDGARGAVGARLPQPLLQTAKAKSGLASTTAVLEYALARVALEDDFGPWLLTQKGSVPKDLDLEF